MYALAEQHPVILELLEIPQLMNACVRNGSYDEALDLKAFASKIALLHPNVEASIRAPEQWLSFSVRVH